MAEQAARELLTIARTDRDEALEVEAGVWLCIHLLQQGKLREALAASHHVRDRLRGEQPGSRLGAARMELLRTIALAGSEAESDCCSNCGFRREDGKRLTSTRVSTQAASRQATSSRAGRVPWPIVKTVRACGTTRAARRAAP